MTVLIIGAGIAGLTTALSLHQIGVDCRVFESVDTIEPLGVGINTLPHAVRELFEIGLRDALAATAVATARLAYYSSRGQRIWMNRAVRQPDIIGRSSPSIAANCR